MFNQSERKPTRDKKISEKNAGVRMFRNFDIARIIVGVDVKGNRGEDFLSQRIVLAGGTTGSPRQ